MSPYRLPVSLWPSTCCYDFPSLLLLNLTPLFCSLDTVGLPEVIYLPFRPRKHHAFPSTVCRSSDMNS